MMKMAQKFARFLNTKYSPILYDRFQQSNECYKRMFKKNLDFHILIYNQIWLNPLTNDHHLRAISQN